MRDEDGELVLTRLDYESPGPVRQLARKSALVRYLIYTVGVDYRAMVSAFQGRCTTCVGNTEAQSSERRLRDSGAAVDTSFRYLPEKAGLGRDRILFIVDAARPELYALRRSEIPRTSYFEQIRAYVLQRPCAEGFEAIEPEPLFREYCRMYGKRFEFEIDGHWNALGHAVVAEQVARSGVIWNAFPNLPRTPLRD